MSPQGPGLLRYNLDHVRMEGSGLGQMFGLRWGQFQICDVAVVGWLWVLQAQLVS
jgi:hypothetical protein